MITLFKWFIILGLVLLAFGGGYLLGHQKPGGVETVEKGASKVFHFFDRTESSIGQSVTEVQIKWRKRSALDHIEKALAEYDRRNYGVAEDAARDARQQIEKWADLTPTEKTKIRPVVRSLEEIQKMIRKESPRTRESLESARKMLEKL
jgi:hypothetical protein